MTRRQFALVLALFSLATPAGAQPSEGKKGAQPARPAEKQPMGQAKSQQQAFLDGERRVAFPKGQPHWHEILEWFIDQSGLPFIGSVPLGSFRHANPQDAAYTC